MLDNLAKGFVKLKREEVFETIKKRVENGEDALKILDEARLGMVAVGDHFQKDDLFLAEMMLSAEIFKEVTVDSSSAPAAACRRQLKKRTLRPCLTQARPMNCQSEISA